jgi:diguanylate cyclase (GGDEF)-like protein/PAS domain S-box-containing protein
MARMLGYSSTEKLIQSVVDFSFQLCVDSDEREELLSRLEERGSVSNFEVRAMRRDGRRIWASISAWTITDKQGRPHTVEGLAEDITERKLSEIHLQRKATFDELTNIPNRFLFLDRFEQMLAQCRRTGQPLSLLYIDLDGFKAVNDSHGHHVGDSLLHEAAQRLHERVRKSDTVARLGGDEFTVLLNNVNDPEDIQTIAAAIIESLSRPYQPEGIECTIGASIGVSIYPQHGDDPDTLINNADAAMYKAKSRGGNACCIYDHSCSFPHK